MILADQIKELEQRREALERCLGIDQKRIDLRNEEEKTQEPDFWDTPDKAREQLRKVAAIKAWVDDYDAVAKDVEDLGLMPDFVKEGVMSEAEMDDHYAQTLERIETLEMRNMLRREEDKLGAIMDINAGAGKAADRVVAAVRRELGNSPAPAEKPTLFMIFDGMVPNIASVVDGIYLALANRVEYAGVNAGSETFQPMPCLFDGERVVGDGLLGLLLPAGMVPLLAHGFAPPERSMGATATEGNRIATLDWRPAFEVYQEIIKAQFGIELTRDNFYQYAVHYPFGILCANGDVVVRIPVVLAEDGALYCVGEIPENALLVLLQAPAAGRNGCIGQLAMNLQSAHGSLIGRQLLSFYCAGRRLHLGDAARTELAQLAEQTGAAALGGALSLGEIGNTVRWGYPMFHNATLVCTPWGTQ